jgi:hypothetical protein
VSGIGARACRRRRRTPARLRRRGDGDPRGTPGYQRRVPCPARYPLRNWSSQVFDSVTIIGSGRVGSAVAAGCASAASPWRATASSSSSASRRRDRGGCRGRAGRAVGRPLSPGPRPSRRSSRTDGASPSIQLQTFTSARGPEAARRRMGAGHGRDGRGACSRPLARRDARPAAVRPGTTQRVRCTTQVPAIAVQLPGYVARGRSRISSALRAPARGARAR